MRERLLLIGATAALAAGCGSAGHSVTAHGRRTPAVGPASLAFSDPVDVAVTPSGMLWVADYRGDSISILRPGLPRPRLVARVATTGGPNRLAVDGSGRIWAAMWDSSELMAWDPTRSDRRPVIVLRVAGMDEPTGLGFDNRGWLWVTTQAGGALLGLAPGALKRSGSVEPSRAVPLPGGASALDEDVAFDAQGRAYVAQYQVDKVVVFDSLQAARPRPALVLHLPLDGPVGARRGPDGAIWITNSTATSLTRLSSGGRRHARVMLTGANMPHSVTFRAGLAYVTDATSWLAIYRWADLLTGDARPLYVAHPTP